ncbi:3-phosphoshikimate 1-carboxyvinyltransferase [Lentibacillus saliphilus]|uniref:3-phosphoshikimate 1-carboxyvinyltransferase n=1 Tax=Lentibacillus saliphilus TaxID=2737028 RepID=UPI001C2FA873|nr:3-phosphoshikimate 1-carboxyvinyltransferase [Lentibacillus saliphilus]
MKQWTFHPVQTGLKGTIRVPGDKSISHRAVMLASLAEGKTTIEGFLNAEDCRRTVHAFQQMGVTFREEHSQLIVESPGVDGFTAPTTALDLGNSGTTARLLLGILATLPFNTTIYGDASLSKRPMGRIVKPLQLMGATIEGTNDDQHLPLTVIGGTPLTGIEYELPVNSAQVKSAILFAGLGAACPTTVIENVPTRNHTELMMRAFGMKVEHEGSRIQLTPQNPKTTPVIQVPGDISSAAFFLVAALLVPNSDLLLMNVGVNSTRTGVIDVLEQMGASMKQLNKRIANEEPVCDIQVGSSALEGIDIDGSIIPRLIDELPLIALAATQAKGRTRIRNAEELRHKETDRIRAVVHTLTRLGAKIEETEDGMIIEGPTSLKGSTVSAYGDHRLAMMSAIASLIAESPVTLDDIEPINVSYPQFISDLTNVTGAIY